MCFVQLVDLDLDSGFFVNPDPVSDPGPRFWWIRILFRIQIQDFDDQKFKNLTVEKC